MNNFCEECGNKLIPENKFCENCGTPTGFNNENTNPDCDKKIENLTYDFFKSNSSLNPDIENPVYGILYTNFKNIEKKFGNSGCEHIKKTISEYNEFLKSSGVYYLVLDSSDNIIKDTKDSNWKKHVKLLRKATKRIKRKLNSQNHFICILGGNEIIPMPLFENPKPTNSDKDVDSDLPYSTLSINDPMKSRDARTPVVSVGRIPTGTNSTVNDIVNVFRNTANSIGNFSTNKSFGVSAYCWQKVSSVINKNVCSDNLFVSPGLTQHNLNSHYNSSTSVHYFNLHGSNRAEHWYGQKDKDYPVAFSPATISGNTSYNIVGVEACYGARFINLSKEQSIVLSALSSKTVSFVGSSRVAWGPASPPMNLADVVIHDYLAKIQNGTPAGIAFLEARVNAFNNSAERDPATSLLTMMEFNLFGDPVFCITGNKSVHKSEFISTGIDGDILQELPDNDIEDKSFKPTDSLYSMVTNAVDSAQRKIVELINTDVWQRNPEFKDIQPVFSKYNFEGKSFMNLTYTKEQDNFDKSILVSLDNNGNVMSENYSK